MKPSPDLEPETAVTVEIQFERYFTPGLRGMLAAFRYETHDLIVQTMDPEDSLLVYRNQGALAASGVEIELEGQCPLGIRFLVDYAHQAPAFETPGEPVVNSPRHLANGRLHVPLAGDALAAAGRLQFVGPRYTLGGGRIDSYLLTHLIVTSRALAPGLEMSLGVYNLLDEHYRDPVSGEHPMDALAQDGRTVRFGFRYGF